MIRCCWLKIEARFLEAEKHTITRKETVNLKHKEDSTRGVADTHVSFGRLSDRGKCHYSMIDIRKSESHSIFRCNKAMYKMTGQNCQKFLFELTHLCGKAESKSKGEHGMWS